MKENRLAAPSKKRHRNYQTSLAQSSRISERRFHNEIREGTFYVQPHVISWISLLSRPFSKNAGKTPDATYWTSMASATFFAVSAPINCSASARPKYTAVPGPRLVVTVPSTTTRSGTKVTVFGNIVSMPA